MGLLSLLFSNPLAFFILAGALLYSVICHEVAHGWVALRFGDDTALRSGRLTLNPLPHIDPMGLLMVFLVGFGWARPVPVSFWRLRPQRLGLICVAFAGCVTNFLLAVAAIFLLHIPFISNLPPLSVALQAVARINIILSAFNLIPFPPLDGSKVVYGILPPQLQRVYRNIEPFGFFVLIALLYLGLLDPVIRCMEQLIYWLISLVFGTIF